jgi:hypothetical protein
MDMADLSQLSVKDLLLAEKIAVESDPFFLIEGEFLTIRTKQGRVEKFKLNSTQRKILQKIKQIWQSGKPIRLWILKARQTGCSTLIEALLYAFTSQRQATNSLVMSKDIDGANYVFGMQKVYHDELDVHLKPSIKHSNEKKLEFASIHSQILIDTADNTEAGRSYTFRYVHLTECAYYADLRKLMLGLNQSVPNLPGTMIIGETTANGIGSQFYDEWVRCKDGLSDWDILFIPWYEMEEYRRAMSYGWYPIEGIKFTTADGKDRFIQDEQSLKMQYGLSDEQLNWRRWCIVNNCNGDMLQFAQEYPISDMEAFVSTGDLFFDKEALKRQVIAKPAIGNIVKEDSRYVFREDPVGLFKVYEFPKKGEQYCGAGDCAEGLESGDKCAGVFLNKRSNKVVASYNHNVSPDRFEDDLIKLGNYYNEAMIAVENKGYGFAVNQGLYRKYGKVYRKVKIKKGFHEPTLDIGFNTNSVSRPMILAQMKEEIASDNLMLNDRELIGQCYTFVNNLKRGQPEAEKGKNDDLVMSCAIACYVRSESPYKPMAYKRPQKTHYRGLAGY